MKLGEPRSLNLFEVRGLADLPRNEADVRLLALAHGIDDEAAHGWLISVSAREALDAIDACWQASGLGDATKSAAPADDAGVA